MINKQPVHPCTPLSHSSLRALINLQVLIIIFTNFARAVSIAIWALIAVSPDVRGVPYFVDTDYHILGADCLFYSVTFQHVLYIQDINIQLLDLGKALRSFAKLELRVPRLLSTRLSTGMIRVIT